MRYRPQIQAGHAAVRAIAPTIFLEHLARDPAVVIDHTHAAMDSQIAKTQDIGAAQAKQQQHLGRPHAHTVKRAERSNGLIIGHGGNGAQIEVARVHLMRAIFYITRLHERDAARLQFFFGRGAYGRRCHFSQVRLHARPHRRLRRRRYLLANNVMHHRRE